MQSPHSRRDFLKFLGRTTALTYGFSALGNLNNLSEAASRVARNANALPFAPIAPSAADKLLLSEGFSYHVIAKWGDVINAEETFGFNNDFVTFIADKKGHADEGILWVNHEYANPIFVSKGSKNGPRTREQVIAEQESVGGSLLRVKRSPQTGKWAVVKNDPLNRRITARTEIPFAWPEPVAGSKVAIGTLANCAGGQTPWGHALTCEENYDGFYGERDFTKPGNAKLRNGDLGWEQYFDYPPEHYGWVVEINPQTGQAKKLVSLGRFAHEAATVYQLPDKRCVVYTGDDSENEHLYKFIGAKPDSLEEGKLYVANVEKGEWISLDINEQPVLKQHFRNQTEVQIRCREAAKLVGATPLDRPEDIEIDPITQDVFVCLTNNAKKGNLFGSLMRIKETNGKDGLTFQASTFLTGGADTGFACPDNMVFDRKGYLWFTSDMSGSAMHKGDYQPFGNNGLFFVPMHGDNAGRAFQVASAPVAAELTGPCFSPDGKTLFLCVQHPGETSESLTQLTSHWPDGGTSIPRPSLVAIQGAALDRIVS